MRTPARPPINSTDRGVDRVATDGADKTHVQEVGPQRRDSPVAEKQALDDQDRGDDHRSGPRAQQYRGQDSTQQVTGDRQWEQREIDHLGRENERRHGAHEYRRPFAQLISQFPQASHHSPHAEDAGGDGDGRGEHSIRNMHDRTHNDDGCGMRIAELRLLRFTDVEDRLVGKRGHPPAFGFQPVSRKVGNGPNKLRLEGECHTAASSSIADQGLQAIYG